MEDRSLTDVIADELRTWDMPVVEPAIYGTADPAAIAGAIAAVVRATTGREIARAAFYSASVGSVAGVTLDDGRRVVVKAHQPHVRRARLEAVHAVMTALADAGFPCPRPLVGPTPIGQGLATIEALVDGARRDGHDPAVRRELARTLVELMRLAPLHDALGASWFTGLPAETLWPRPHSPLFDFETTRAGAERIDAIAAAARAVPRAGQRCTGHFDWRAEHARFDGDRMIVAYDWDSLHVDLEPVCVGAAAHAFCADWERDDVPAAPELDELHAFIADVEAARGARFDGDQRATLAGSLIYSLAYTARCTHALGEAAGPRSRSFIDLAERASRTRW